MSIDMFFFLWYIYMSVTNNSLLRHNYYINKLIMKINQTTTVRKRFTGARMGYSRVAFALGRLTRVFGAGVAILRAGFLFEYGDCFDQLTT